MIESFEELVDLTFRFQDNTLTHYYKKITKEIKRRGLNVNNRYFP
jgi:hypothetical protein